MVEELQVENGGFTRIVNRLMEELVKIPFNGSELALILFIIRKTYGHLKTEDQISLTQFQKGLNRSRPSIVNLLKNLQLVNIVQLVKKGSSKKCSNTWKINKYYKTWELVKYEQLVKYRHIQLVKRVQHTKETLTKEIISDISKKKVGTDKMFKEDSRKFSDEYEVTLDSETGLPIQPKVSTVGKSMKDLLGWAAKRRGFGFQTPGKQYAAMKRMRVAGVKPDEVKRRWEEMENDKFWQDKGFDFTNVAASLDKKR